MHEAAHAFPRRRFLIGAAGVAGAAALPVAFGRAQLAGAATTGRVTAADATISYLGPNYANSWSTVSAVAGAINNSYRYSPLRGAVASLTFAGPSVHWIGTKLPNGGIAEVWIDGVHVTDVDTYAASRLPGQVLYASDQLPTTDTAKNWHTIRVASKGTRNPASTGTAITVEAFDCTQPIDAVATLAGMAQAELVSVSNGTKVPSNPSSWAAAASVIDVPLNGVVLGATKSGLGVLGTCFRHNVYYIRYSYAQPNFVDPLIPASNAFWYTSWPTANEGRLLAGAGHSLRFLDPVADADAVSALTGIVTDLVNRAAARQLAANDPNAGYCLAYPVSAIQPQGTAAKDGEKPNYDRAMWTRGMIAAMLSGNQQAGQVLRRFYDWFNADNHTAAASSWGPTDLGKLLSDSLGVQGHVGSTLVYQSSVGKAEDLLTAEKFYVQDWFLDRLTNQQPLAVSSYPLDRPHSYLIIALEAYLDHYMATGDVKYLNAVLGGSEMFRRDFTYGGDGTSIVEHTQAVPAGTQNLDVKNNEGCGSVFWIDLNHRLLRLAPTNEFYAAEIEKYLYNVCVAQQAHDAPYGIRYHALYEGRKESATVWNTCDEITECGLYGRLPQYVYSIWRSNGQAGIIVNLFESSSISFDYAPKYPSYGKVKLTTETSFPYGMHVSHTLSLDAYAQQRVASAGLYVSIRVPSWATGPMSIYVNGWPTFAGAPGTYAGGLGTFRDGDVISYDLPIGFRLTPYTGMSQINGSNPATSYQRFSLHYGPILMAVSGAAPGTMWTSTYRQSNGGQWVPRIPTDSSQLISQLVPLGNLEFAAPGGYHFKPYFLVDDEALSCFPIVQTQA
ncbi:MAG: uncharacterized protein QOG80_2525 [Pseudonocardiales bacterium]|nr:uncharacterized protein [Pseudonocardiales bacterium]